MDRDKIIELLRAHKAELGRRYGLHSLAVFGSIARNTASTCSDVDLLVTFDGPATTERYFGVQFYLEDLLHRPIDLVTDKALRPEFRTQVEREAIHVYPILSRSSTSGASC
jgi:predicted nucleotidyltransferase